MLQSINDRIQGWLGWLIVALISVPFALWGIQSYLEVGGNKFLAKVNDTEITPAQFDRALSRQLARLQEMFGKNMPKSDAYDQMLKKQVLDQLITTEVLNQYATESGYTVADASLASAIQEIDAFKEDGQFSAKLYERILNSQGMSIPGFEAVYRQELATSHIQNAIMASSITTSSEIEQQWKLNNQHRNISFIEFKSVDYLKQISVSDDEAKKYYEQNSFRYMNPEQVSIQYIELKTEQLENEIPVNEADIKKSYDAYVANAKSNEQRKASHILVNLASDASEADKNSALEKISKVKKELDAGGSFSALAKKYSDDEGSAINGGDLGIVSKGMMVKPFEESLFALKKGQVSEVVRSEFGYHIIRLDEIKAASIDSYAAKKSSIEKELKESGVQNLFYERAELMANMAYENPESLDLVAEQLKLKIQKSTLFSRSSGTGITTNAKVRNSAFEDAILKEKLNSDAIEISNKHVTVIRINEHKPSTAKSFDEVKAVIVSELKFTKAKQQAKEKADSLNEKLNKDSSVISWNNITSEFNSNTKSLNLVKRDSTEASKQLIEVAFKLSKPETNKVSYKQITLNNGNTAIVTVLTVNDSIVKADKAASDAATKKLNNQLSNQEYAAVVAEIKAQAEIYI
ncbi:MAG: SurA N-terminal domain-containing protein, partial [Gammaproteobacteria bacterium]|nr:SurA N-terminal domain-containing protein [Gammaproteobacteria bacterium]